MGVKSDAWIRAKASQGMIEPFEENQVHTGNVISYGVSSYGYDMRLAREFKLFRAISQKPDLIIDPKNFNDDLFEEIEADVCIIPPNSFVLGRSVERFVIPRGVLTICLGKSTYARCGLIVNVTPLEPEWEGYVTIEISNTTPHPAKVYAGEGISQVLFLGADVRGYEPMTNSLIRWECEQSYRDKKGKYQNQTGVTPAKVNV